METKKNKETKKIKKEKKEITLSDIINFVEYRDPVYIRCSKCGEEISAGSEKALLVVFRNAGWKLNKGSPVCWWCQ